MKILATELGDIHLAFMLLSDPTTEATDGIADEEGDAVLLEKITRVGWNRGRLIDCCSQLFRGYSEYSGGCHGHGSVGGDG